MKKSRITIACLSMTLLLSVGVAVGLSEKDVLPSFVSVNATDYHLLLNDAQSPFISSETSYQNKTKVITSANPEVDDQTIEIKNGKYLADGFAALEEGGMVYKEEATNSLVSITAVFDGSLDILSNYENDFETGSYYSIHLTSGSQATIYGNYWRLVATADTNVTSLDVVYGCRTAADSPSYGSVTVSSFYDEDNYFVNYCLIGEDYYLSFNGVASSSFNSSRLLPSELKIEDLSCEFIKYSDLTHFKAYFNLSDWSESLIANNVSANASRAIHAFLRNDPLNVYNASGDLRHKDYRVQECDVDCSNGRNIKVTEMTWGEGTGYMAKVEFSPIFGIASLANTSLISGTSFTFVNNTHFRIRMITKSNSIKSLSASSFKLYSDEGHSQNEVAASRVAVGSDYDGYGYVLDIDFPIDVIYNLFVDAGGQDNYNYWAHLFINGSSYDENNSKGDLKTKETYEYSGGSLEYVKWSKIYQSGEDTNANMNLFKAYSMVIIRISKRG